MARKVTRGRAMAADVDKEAANIFVFISFVNLIYVHEM